MFSDNINDQNIHYYLEILFSFTKMLGFAIIDSVNIKYLTNYLYVNKNLFFYICVYKEEEEEELIPKQHLRGNFIIKIK